jgi:elongation factor 2
MVALSKSTNRFNRLWAKAHPLGQELTQAIETRKVNPDHDHLLRADLLANKYAWDAVSARKIWCFGPDTTGPNLLVDATKSVSCLNEIKDACVVGFQWATKESVCMEEEMRGVRLNILNVGVS